MSKFSLFTLFLSATIVVIVAELMVNEYVKYPVGGKNLSASVLQSDLSPSPMAEKPPVATQEQSGIEISYALISAAGFKDSSLQRIPFNGIMFESLDLRDFKSVPVTANNLLENNRKTVATFYEFRANSRMLSTEVYRMLKEKSGKLIGAAANETNNFGEGSFFINFVERPGSAFLVVNTGDNVYALTYLKELHPMIKSLLAEIVKGDSVSKK